jgi:stage II sporulation protein GA (sporulation sigma-E factor processing peptidase)
MVTVYIDRVFALNMLVDYLLLLTAARLAGAPLRRLRTALAAALGGLYAAAVFLPGCAFLSGPLWKILAGVAMALLVYWPQRRRWALTALFLLLSGALAGLLLAVGLASGDPARRLAGVFRAEISWPVFAGTGAGFYLLLRAAFRRDVRLKGGDILRVTIRIGGRRRELSALHDTGNTLRDPVNGEPVLVLEQRAVRDLWPPEIGRILDQPLSPEEKMAQLHRRHAGRSFSLIPYRSVGVPAGLLLAFRSDALTVEGRIHRRVLLALSESPLSENGAYQALWGGEVGRRHDGTPAHREDMDPALDHAG